MIVVSPHLDDALLSLAAWITAQAPPSRVVTVFAGEPPEWLWPTPFDSLCGFTSSRDAVRARQAEDVQANGRAHLREPWHLHFKDGQYGIPPYFGHIVDTLVPYVGAMTAPLGLVHPDHELVALACREALSRSEETTATVYADLPSAALHPESIEPAIEAWHAAGWSLTEARRHTLTVGELDRKDEILAAYASQRRLRELGIENLGVEITWTATRT